MLTFDDCVAFSPLTTDEVEAISRHAHVPELCALELGAHLLHSADGAVEIAAMLHKEIAKAQSGGDLVQVVRLRRALNHLQQEYVELADERSADGRTAHVLE